MYINTATPPVATASINLLSNEPTKPPLPAPVLSVIRPNKPDIQNNIKTDATLTAAESRFSLDLKISTAIKVKKNGNI